jgi:hypothetical protein
MLDVLMAMMLAMVVGVVGMVVVLEDYVGIGEASRRLGISEQRVRDLMDAGRLQGVRDPSNRRWILRADLEREIAARANRAKGRS